MELRYDEELVESAVFACASGPRPTVPQLQIARFHRERERLYTILDPDERSAAFFKLHLEWFREWRLEKVLRDLLAAFPALQTELDLLAFRKARGRHEEGAELYVQAEAGRSAVVALRAERFRRVAELTAFLRHEFMHLRDMVDPAFAYSPQLHLPGQNPGHAQLVRERYRLLWDITIDGRLTAAGHISTGNRELHRANFDRAFGFWPETRRDEVFTSLWTGREPRHNALLAMAADPRDLREAQGPLPGTPCPLCGFPTFKWVIGASIRPEIATIISAEFPHWTTPQGMCHRCCEVYEVASARNLQRTSA